MEDIVKVVVDIKKKKNKVKTAGEFKCIYSGDGWKNQCYRINPEGKNPDDD